jgi:TetR/AcrR family transcriptional regulator
MDDAAQNSPQGRPPHRYPARRTKPLILQAAEKVFAEAGFGGATMQLIADMAGLPKANLHYYFATKEDLYRRVVQNIFEIWLHAADSFRQRRRPRHRHRRLYRGQDGISRDHPFGSKVWASEVMHGAPVIQDYLETTLRDWTEGRAALIQRWIDEGKMAPVDPRHLLYMLWATTQHYADFGHQIETLNGGRPFTDRQWRAATESVKTIILRGIGLAPA